MQNRKMETGVANGIRETREKNRLGMQIFTEVKDNLEDKKRTVTLKENLLTM